MKDILSEIIAHKRVEVEQQKQAVSEEALKQQVERLMQEGGQQRGGSMKQSLAASPTGIIAEFKRRSPSKGWIKESAQADLIPPAYEAAGAGALSILTDEKFFGGSLRDIRTARPLVNIPILRKDFIIDPYQLLQARIVGADAVLLIAACLSLEECGMLATQAHTLGLEVLLEIHSPEELAYAALEVDMVGVNNRNLGSFITDVENSFRIAEALRRAVGGRAAGKTAEPTAGAAPLLVSESGISHPDTIRNLRAAGFRGFLIGETFMKTEEPGKTLKEMIDSVTKK